MNFFPSLVDLLRSSSLRFDTGVYRHIEGGYIFDSYLPPDKRCKCIGVPLAGRKLFHRHGHYPRQLTSFVDGHLSTFTVWNLRWQCPLCDATFSVPPPNVLRRQRICIFVVFSLALIYLNSPRGLDACYPPELDTLRERAQLRAYLRNLRDTAGITQQSIREAILQRVGPEDYERLTLSGLSPPESNRKCRDPLFGQIRGSLQMIETCSRFLNVPISLTLSRARERATMLGRPFLTEIR